jgi:rubrerythrin
MATQSKERELPKIEQAGRILAKRLREARKAHGWLRCPVCLMIFEATHVMKCPECRTLINKTFQSMGAPEPSGKMELDFFLQP